MYRFVPSLDDYGIIKEEGEKAFNVSIDENRFIRLQEERVYLVYRGEAVKTDTMYMRKERERAKERERERKRGNRFNHRDGNARDGTQECVLQKLGILNGRRRRAKV